MGREGSFIQRAAPRSDGDGDVPRSVCERVAAGQICSLILLPGGSDAPRTFEREIIACLGTPTCRLRSLDLRRVDVPPLDDLFDIRVVDVLAPTLEEVRIIGRGDRPLGALPPTIGGLRSLEVLVVRGELPAGLLEGEIPPQIGKLKRLRNLHLDENALVGPIPLTLAECPDLINVNLADNELTGRL
ncbi:hypothetical protein AURANDRAFT_25842, partial [Aureococcus anophagefferens]